MKYLINISNKYIKQQINLANKILNIFCIYYLFAYEHILNSL